MLGEKDSASDYDQLRTELSRLADDLEWLSRPLAMHHGRAVTRAPFLSLPPDERNDRPRLAVARVIEAFARATADESLHSRPSSMWQMIEDKQRRFIDALGSGDHETVGEMLSTLMHSELGWGLASTVSVFEQDHPERGGGWVQLAVADLIVSFAEAIGCAYVSTYQQGEPLERRDLDTDLDALLVTIEARTGLDLGLASVGAPFGCRVAGKLVTPDSVRHSYTLAALRRLGATPSSTIAEIGGGVGCFVDLAVRAGHRDVRVYDLPWVNALQGYYLLMSQPPDLVRLYGEESGSVCVEPYWCYGELADRSVDFVVNTNSLPEVGLDAARAYVAETARVLRGSFLSINHEGRLTVGIYGPQNCVRELVEEAGSLTPVSRNRSWMWEGYVEEVFVPMR